MPLSSDTSIDKTPYRKDIAMVRNLIASLKQKARETGDHAREVIANAADKLSYLEMNSMRARGELENVISMLRDAQRAASIRTADSIVEKLWQLKERAQAWVAADAQSRAEMAERGQVASDTQDRRLANIARAEMNARGARASDAQDRWLASIDRASTARAEMNARGAKAANQSFWQSVMNTLNSWKTSAQNALTKQFDESNILHKIGLGNWGRLGIAAVGASALAAAYYAWKKHNANKSDEQRPVELSNASYIPDFSGHILVEMEQIDAMLRMLSEAGDVPNNTSPGFVNKIESIVASIKAKVGLGKRDIKRALNDPDIKNAPRELVMQMQQVSQMLDQEA